MMKYVVCGTNIEDVEAGVKAMKMAIASGATCGVGGNTMAEVEKNLDAMKQMVGGVAPSQMGRDCLRSPNGYCPYCEDEEEEDIDYCEGYMAMTKRGKEISDLCECPGEAMVDAINEGYDLDEIYINEVRVYDDDAVEVIDTVYPLID